MRNKKIGLLGAVMMLAASAAAADSGLFIGIGNDFGGDTIGEVWFDDGADGVVRANQGFEMDIGVSLPVGAGLSLQSSIGVQWSERLAGNGSMGWQSFPWRNLLVAELGSWSLGGGVVYFIEPELSTDGVLAPLGGRRYDDALGYQAELAYRLFRNPGGGGMAVGARYITVDFTTPEEEQPARGDSGGVFARFLF